MREWRKRNPERWREIQERYWQKKFQIMEESEIERKQN